MFKIFFTFDRFIFPRIASVIYWAGLAIIVLATLGSAFGVLLVGNQAAHMGAGVGRATFGFVLALLGGAIAVVVWRVIMEFWLVIFSIRDTLREIRDQGRTH